MKEVKGLKTFNCNYYLEKMARNFNPQDNEKFFVFVTKDKRQAVILTMSDIEY